MLAEERTTEGCTLGSPPEDSVPQMQLQLQPSKQSNLAESAEGEAGQEEEEAAEGCMLSAGQRTGFCSSSSLQSSLASKHKVSVR